MAVRMRLTRMGAKKRPFYRIVVADARAPRDGRALDIIGYYDPISQPKKIKVDRAKADHWLSVGAQPTDRVKYLLEQAAAAPAEPEPVVEQPAARGRAKRGASLPSEVKAPEAGSAAAPAEASAPAGEPEAVSPTVDRVKAPSLETEETPETEREARSKPSSERVRAVKDAGVPADPDAEDAATRGHSPTAEAQSESPTEG